MKKRLSLLLPPAAAGALALLVFAAANLFPLGSNMLAWCDMKQQVVPILLDLKNVLTGKDGMFLNMANAGGMSFLGVFFFFVSSPFSFLILFVQPTDAFLLANILVLLKMMACAFTAGLFFYFRNPGLTCAQRAAFSVMYAFCGYVMMYFQNVVWLDMVCLFPILLLGFFRLMEKDQMGLYVFALSAMLTVNFYLSYMVVLFLIFCFGGYAFFCADRRTRGKKALLLGLATLLVAFLTAVVWFPSLMQYLDSARTVSLTESLQKGSFVTYWRTTLPVVFSNAVIPAALIFTVLLPDHLDNWDKFLLSLFGAMSIPLILEPINKMWHTGSYQAFPVRYGYMTVFLGLMLAAGAAEKLNARNELLEGGNLGASLGLLAAVLGMAGLGYWLLDTQYQELTVYTRTLWENKSSFSGLFCFGAAAFCCYVLLFLFYQRGWLNRHSFSAVLCAVVFCESVFSGGVFLGSASAGDEFYREALSLSGRIKDDSLYRVKFDGKYFDSNLIGAMGYRSLNHYTSLTREEYLFMMKRLGYSAYWMEVDSNGGTELTDALLSNKYSIIYSYRYDGERELTYFNPYFSIVKNQLSLPFGTVFHPENIAQLRELPQGERIDAQETLFRSVFSSGESLFQEYPVTETENVKVYKGESTAVTRTSQKESSYLTYQIKVGDAQTLYLDCFDQVSTKLREVIYGSLRVFVNGNLIQASYPSQSSNGLLKLGTFSNETVTVKLRVLKDLTARSFGVFGLKKSVLETAVERADCASLTQRGSRLEGTVTAGARGDYLLLPLSYGKGYTVLVNGKSAEIYPVFGNMMAVELEIGENRISVSYIPPGFLPGVCLTGVGAVILPFLLWYFCKRGCPRKRMLEFTAGIVFSVLFFAAVMMIYVFPMIVHAIR